MEAFFTGIQKFFPQFCRHFQGEKAQLDQSQQQIGRQPVKPQHPAAQEEEVEAAAGQNAQNQIKSHVAVARPDTVEEQSGGEDQKEQQIQHPVQQPLPEAQGAQQVVQRPGGGAQRHGPQKSQGLGRHVQRHPSAKQL